MKIIPIEDFKRIYESEVFKNDFLDLFGKSKGDIKTYKNFLLRCLNLLDKEGLNVLDLSQFEQLRDTNPRLYAIRHPNSRINERHIFIVACDEERFILLTSFLEKNKNDYKKAIIKAQNIYEKLEW